MMTCWNAVSIQYQNVTDRKTDRIATVSCVSIAVMMRNKNEFFPVSTEMTYSKIYLQYDVCRCRRVMAQQIMSSLDLQLLFALCTTASCLRCPTQKTLQADLFFVETVSSHRLPLPLLPCLLPLPLAPLPR